jgi:hypothetical protein
MWDSDRLAIRFRKEHAKVLRPTNGHPEKDVQEGSRAGSDGRYSARDATPSDSLLMTQLSVRMLGGKQIRCRLADMPQGVRQGNGRRYAGDPQGRPAESGPVTDWLRSRKGYAKVTGADERIV